MNNTETAIGIDFGTTNTRVAFYDKGRLRIVPFFSKTKGQSYQLPTLISYQDGSPIAFGEEARSTGSRPPGPIKWLLNEEDPVDVNGSRIDPVDMAAAFFGHLRKEVAHVIQPAELNHASVTIPVHFPTRARRNLQEALTRAGIEVERLYYEPVAAIYCDMLSHKTSGVAAVFDWGGGSLDLATVHIRDGIAFTGAVEGWHRGGNDFDELIRHHVLYDFFKKNPELPLDPEIVNQMKAGQDLLEQAQDAKITLSARHTTELGVIAFLFGKNLSFPLPRDTFNDWIHNDVTGAIARMEHVLHASNVSWAGLSRLFLSGGTCNIPRIKMLLEEKVGARLVNRLKLPAELHAAPGGLDDVGNATAIGAAMLAVHASQPVLGNDIGVRLAHTSGDRFDTVFHRGEALDYKSRKRQYFITDASCGVARLLVCERRDPIIQQQGRLLRVLTVPIDKNEGFLDVEFTIGPQLVLTIKATGRIAKSTISHSPSGAEPADIHQLNLGFHMPVLKG
jgi:molecular chaperone DnaK (HSP70)